MVIIILIIVSHIFTIILSRIFSLLLMEAVFPNGGHYLVGGGVVKLAMEEGSQFLRVEIMLDLG